MQTRSQLRHSPISPADSRAIRFVFVAACARKVKPRVRGFLHFFVGTWQSCLAAACTAALAVATTAAKQNKHLVPFPVPLFLATGYLLRPDSLPPVRPHDDRLNILQAADGCGNLPGLLEIVA